MKALLGKNVSTCSPTNALFARSNRHHEKVLNGTILLFKKSGLQTHDSTEVQVGAKGMAPDVLQASNEALDAAAKLGPKLSNCLLADTAARHGCIEDTLVPCPEAGTDWIDL